MFEKSTPMEKRNILGSLSTISVGESFAHTKYRNEKTRNGSHGSTKLEKLTLWEVDGGEPCTSPLVLLKGIN